MKSKLKFLIPIVILVPILMLWMGRRTNNWPITNDPPTGEAIIALGDSLTSGVGASEGNTYVDVLSDMIGRPILNSGVPGETTGDALKRLDRDVLSEDPRVVIVLLGGNDMLRRVSQDEQFANLREIVESIQAEGALVVLVGLKEIGFFTEGGYDSRYKVLARETGSVLVPNILGGIMFDRDLMSDQIHPNDAGYAKVAEKIDDIAGEYLRR
ncbi:arylesterase [bacterium]|nr:arylesterase [bacterium]